MKDFLKLIREIEERRDVLFDFVAKIGEKYIEEFKVDCKHITGWQIDDHEEDKINIYGYTYDESKSVSIPFKYFVDWDGELKKKRDKEQQIKDALDLKKKKSETNKRCRDKKKRKETYEDLKKEFG